MSTSVADRRRPLRARPVALAAALAVALPTLLPWRASPHAVFFAEWGAALLFLLAVAVGGRAGRGWRVAPWVLPALCTLTLVWSPAPAGWLAYPALLALAACWAGEAEQDLAPAVAVGLLLGAVGQSLAGLAQLVGTEAGGLVMPRLYKAVFGNVGQANHYANLVWLGLAGAVYLRASGRLRGAVFGGLVVWLALAAAASASRSVWLFSTAFLLLALFVALRDARTHRRLALALLAVAAASACAQFAAAQGLFDAFGLVSSASRAGDASSNGQRLHDWAVAWQAIRAAPWTGHGFGSFYGLTADAAAAGPALPFPMLAEHAHNLPLNLAAELGLPVTAALLGAVLVWGVGQLRAPVTPERCFALAGLSVIGLHSMVEYPLWYSYFVIPAGLLVGLADQGRPGLRVAMPRLAQGAAVALGGIVLVLTLRDWLAVHDAQQLWGAAGRRSTPEVRAAVRARLDAVPEWSLFAAYARNQRLQTWQPAADTAPWMARQCDTHWKTRPDWTVMIHCTSAYAATGQAQKLDELVQVLCRGFPRHHALARQWVAEQPELGGLRVAPRYCLAGPASGH